MEKHTYAFSDLHGVYDLWAQIRNYAQPQDTLIFLGDAIDRGPHGIKIMKELLEDPRVIYICGNHELMMLNAWEDPLEMALWKANGANKTRKDLMRIPHNERIELIANLKHQITKYAIYLNKQNKQIILTHSGFNPDIDKDLSDTAWNRKHIAEEWTQNLDYHDAILVHGHTISWTLNEYNRNINPDKVVAAITYCQGHKIDIDMGTIITGKACLLDLDTLQPIYFTIEK